MRSTALPARNWTRDILRCAGWIATLGLVLFHLRLFAGRLRDATLSKPEVQARWLLAVALLGLAVWFRRRGLSLWRGRPAVVFWLLALLLHLGPMPLPATPEPVNGLLVALPWALAAPLLALLGRRFANRSAAPQHRRSTRSEPPRPRHALLLVRSPRFSPRPPPAA